MRKFFSFVACTIAVNICLSQSPVSVDSNKAGTVLPSTPKVNNLAGASPALIVYPNPAKNKITLQVKNFDAGMVQVRLLDIKGKMVRDDTRLLTNGNEDIIMFLMLKAGIYFIAVSGPGKVVRKKLVVL